MLINPLGLLPICESFSHLVDLEREITACPWFVINSWALFGGSTEERDVSAQAVATITTSSTPHDRTRLRHGVNLLNSLFRRTGISLKHQQKSLKMWFYQDSPFTGFTENQLCDQNNNTHNVNSMFGFSGGLIWRHLVEKMIQIWIYLHNKQMWELFLIWRMVVFHPVRLKLQLKTSNIWWARILYILEIAEVCVWFLGDRWWNLKYF